jgi:hypothetical protein
MLSWVRELNMLLQRTKIEISFFTRIHKAFELNSGLLKLKVYSSAQLIKE